MTAQVNVTVASAWLRPWINEEPISECETKKWKCMTQEERQAYVESRAQTIVTNYE